MSGKSISAVISTVAKYIERRRAQTLGRFPVDVLFAVAIPIIMAVFPLTWWLKALLLVGLALILAELLWRIPAPRQWKLVAVVLAIMAVTAVGFQPVREQYYEDAFFQDYQAKRDLAAKYAAHDLSLKRIVAQYDRLKQAQSLFDTTNKDQYAEIDKQSLEDIKVTLNSLEVVATPAGDGLKIRLGQNMFRIVLPVPMRITPKVTFFGDPDGVAALIVEQSNIGVTVLFLPLSVAVEHFNATFSADL